MCRKTIAILFLAILFSHGRASASILLNASFENPDVPDTGYTDTDPTNWVVTESETFQVSLFDRPDFPAVEGDQFLAFNASGTSPGSSIHQTFSTISGASYDVSFWATANIPARSSVNAKIIDGAGLGGSTLVSQNSILGGAFAFTQTTFSFVAASGTTTLAFVDNSSQTSLSDLFLDNVEISIPEPSTMIMALGSILFCIGRRTRNRFTLA